MKLNFGVPPCLFHT